MFLKKRNLIAVIAMVVLLTTMLIAAASAATGGDGEGLNSDVHLLDNVAVFLPWVASDNGAASGAAEQCAEDKLVASSEHIACLVEAEIAANDGADLEDLIAACDAARDEAYAAAEAVAASEGVACAPDQTKGMYYGSMQRSNIPPVAHIEVLDNLPLGNAIGSVSLSAQGSSDSDGVIHHFFFRVEDAETGEVLAGPLDSRKPHVRIPVPSAAPTQTLRAVVTVEDDMQALDTAEALAAAAPPTCHEDKAVTCWITDAVFGRVTCTFKNDSGIDYALQVEEILYAGQACNPAITSTTQLAIMGLGGSGGGGGDSFYQDGGDYGYGGVALVGTTWEELIEAAQFICFGVAQQASHSGLTGGSGGASTIMRKCDSNGTDHGVILVAGGGGGGGPGSQPTPGDGGDGGIAISSTAGACPPDCLPGSSDHGYGDNSSLHYGRGGGEGEGGSSDCTDHENSAKGEDGFGGRGGKSSWGSAGWLTGNAFVPGATGQGGTDSCSSGAGGGGYGGGASGSSLDGGGGGGSYAMKSSWDLSTIGYKIETNPGDGIIQFVFYPN
ncbi:MAG: hypothetical protein GY764_01415 [Halieaceae bacterium]|nr:hypothetical protein [Halieaceae bacterium]